MRKKWFVQGDHVGRAFGRQRNRVKKDDEEKKPTPAVTTISIRKTHPLDANNYNTLQCVLFRHERADKLIV